MVNGLFIVPSALSQRCVSEELILAGMKRSGSQFWYMKSGRLAALMLAQSANRCRKQSSMGECDGL